MTEPEMPPVRRLSIPCFPTCLFLLLRCLYWLERSVLMLFLRKIICIGWIRAVHCFFLQFRIVLLQSTHLRTLLGTEIASDIVSVFNGDCRMVPHRSQRHVAVNKRGVGQHP